MRIPGVGNTPSKVKRRGNEAGRVAGLTRLVMMASDLEYVVNNKLRPACWMTRLEGTPRRDQIFRRTSQELDALQTGRDLGRSNRAVSEEEELLAGITDPRLRRDGWH